MDPIINLKVPLTKDGIYNVAVTEINAKSGSYTFAVKNVASGIDTLVSYGDVVDAEISPAGDVDGYSFEFPDWRFNIRMSNTEPVVRLNVESRADFELMEKKTEEILKAMEKA